MATSASAILDGDLPGGWPSKSPEESQQKPSGAEKFGPNDLFIAVMGITGSGKSTFISKCAEGTSLDVPLGHGLKSHTGAIQVYPIDYNGKRVHLIDTPGFDDTYRADIDVLKDVTFWLSKAYKRNTLLTGIVYLHRITDPRMGGTALKDLTMFKKLCGEESFGSIVLATTMWEYVKPKEMGEAREQELRDSPEFFGEMLRNGSVTMRHMDNSSSARNILSYLINRRTTTVLNIQREMAKEGASLEDTEAGKELEGQFLKQKELFEKKLKETEERMKEALDAKDKERANELSAQQEQLNRMIKAVEKGREDLRIDMERLFAEKEAQYRAVLAELEATRKEREEAVKMKEEELAEWKKSMAEAQKVAEQRRKQQEADIEQQLSKVSSHNDENYMELQARMRKAEEENRRLAHNLQQAQLEEARRAEELRETELEAATAISAQLHRPELYQGDPPEYGIDDIIDDKHLGKRTRKVLAVAAAVGATATGVGVGAAALAPLCTLM